MKNLTLPIALFVLILIAGLVLLILPGKSTAPTTNPQATTTPAGIADLIVVDLPVPNSLIASPLKITGTARGNWYFEASFPIELKNASGTVIAQHYAEAQSDWMTENFVPFMATLTFPAQPAGSTGILVLKKDNPSGDPAKDQSVEIPITF